MQLAFTGSRCRRLRDLVPSRPPRPAPSLESPQQVSPKDDAFAFCNSVDVVAPPVSVVTIRPDALLPTLLASTTLVPHTLVDSSAFTVHLDQPSSGARDLPRPLAVHCPHCSVLFQRASTVLMAVRPWTRVLHAVSALKTDFRCGTVISSSGTLPM